MRSYDKKLARRLAAMSPAIFAKRVKNPVFIIGCGRSGTTMLVKLLSNHDQMATFPNEGNRLWHPETYPWLEAPDRRQFPPFWIDPLKFTQHSQRRMNQRNRLKLKANFGAYQFLKGKEIFLNKSAMLTYLLPFIEKEFPGAKFIHIIRNGLAVSRSFVKKLHQVNKREVEIYFQENGELNDQELLSIAGKIWHHHMEEVERQKNLLNLKESKRILEFHYEEFCEDPKFFLKKICLFIGMDPDQFHLDNQYPIRNMNYKFQEEFDKLTLQRLTKIMEASLSIHGYLN